MQTNPLNSTVHWCWLHLLPCIHHLRRRPSLICRLVHTDKADARVHAATGSKAACADLDGQQQQQHLGTRSLAIITGASRGLGKHIVQQLLAAPDPSLVHGAQRHDFLLLARDASRLNKLVKHLQQATSHSSVCIMGHAVDLGDMNALKTTLPKLISGQEQGGLLPCAPSTYRNVLLVHNAGTTGDLVYSWELQLEHIRREMDLNITSPTAITAAVVGHFKQEVLVVNISSVSATQPFECFSLYAAGKAARLMLSRTLAHEAELVHNPHIAAHADLPGCIAATNPPPQHTAGPVIRSLSFAPGALDTDMQSAARRSLPQSAPLKRAFEHNASSGRLVDPALSARVLVGILGASRDSWTNGQHVDVYDHCPAGASSRHPLAYQPNKMASEVPAV